ncbi:MAG: hypothetical protein V1689_08660 [Pseudomonadota bacterium]
MPYRYKRRRKKVTKRQVKLYLSIVVACILTTAGIYLATEIVPRLIQQQIDNALISQTVGTPDEDAESEALRKLGKLAAGKIDPATVGNLVRAYKGREVEVGPMGGSGKEYFDGRTHPRTSDRFIRAARGRKGEPGPGDRSEHGGVDQATIDKLTEAYRGGKISQTDMEKAREAYRKGEIDPALVEKAKKALAGAN